MNACLGLDSRIPGSRYRKYIFHAIWRDSWYFPRSESCFCFKNAFVILVFQEKSRFWDFGLFWCHFLVTELLIPIRSPKVFFSRISETHDRIWNIWPVFWVQTVTRYPCISCGNTKMNFSLSVTWNSVASFTMNWICSTKWFKRTSGCGCILRLILYGGWLF